MYRKIIVGLSLEHGISESALEIARALRAEGGEVRFLERSEDDGRVEMSLTQSVSIRDFEEDVMGTILEEEDPPEVVTLSGREYAAVEASTGTQSAPDDEQEETDKDADNNPPGRPFVSWTYESKEGRVVYVVLPPDGFLAGSRPKWTASSPATTP